MNITYRTGVLVVAGLLVTLMLVSSVSAQTTGLTVTKTVDPGAIYVYDPVASCTPQASTVTLSVTGYGGTVTSSAPIDVVFGIDSSGSMGWNDPSNVRLSGAQALVGQLQPSRDQVGVVSWDESIDFADLLTYDLNAASAKIGTIDSSGGTIPEPALQRCIDLLDANTRTGSSSKVIIFVTDAEFYETLGDFADEIAEANSKGYDIYTVGLIAASQTVLEGIATQTGGKYYFADDANDFSAIYQDILSTIVTNTAPSNVDVVEVTMPYIVEEGSFSVQPDSVTTDADGKTTITWLNVGQWVGNNDEKLDETETFTVTFSAGSSQAGDDLAVDDAAATVNYVDPAGASQTTAIPQATLDVQVCNQPPDVTNAYPSINCLWPPNNKFVAGKVLGVTDPDGDDVTITITGITSDEATSTTLGAGGPKAAPDAKGVNTNGFEVRAERSGNLNGRVYAVSFTADDGKTNGQTTGTIYVKVPHDQSKPNVPCTAVDDGQNYDATAIN